MIRDKVKKIYTTLYNALHQNFYTSCEIFTPAALAPLATFSISELNEERINWQQAAEVADEMKNKFITKEEENLKIMRFLRKRSENWPTESKSNKAAKMEGLV